MYYYNSWDATYKSPFGAIKVGDVMKINFSTDRSDVSVKFIIRRDFGMRHEFEMQKNSEGRFSSSVKFDVGHGLYFYYFEISEPSDWGNVKHFYGRGDLGGEGLLYMNETDITPYQVTVFDKEDPAPEWYRNAIFYQIFPDRFNNGNPEGKINHPKPNSFLYGTYEDEPLYIKNEKGDILRWDFFGGNLRGILNKIPYLKELGINALYLNPIFSATSNHRYDTNDYLEIDSMLGTEADFRELIQSLHQNGMHLILDGVFSHVGKNSRYFNLSGDYGDDIGAAKTPESPYFDWFKFTDYPTGYKSWWGIKDLPEIDKDNDHFRHFIYGKEDSVLAKWNAFEIDGWRLDVADELPDSFIRGIRENLKNYPDKVLIGEVWEDASNKISYGKRRDYILGDSLHGCMNYPFRDLIIRYLTEKISARDAAHHLMSLSENYPKDIFYNNLNNLGTHDTERILTMIGQENNTNAVALLFVLPGIPCIYYGDEVEMTGAKDPQNRKYFPWKKERQVCFQSYQHWAQLRRQENSLKEGKFLTFHVDNLLGILRYTDTEAFFALFNPSEETVKVDSNKIVFLQKVSFIPQLLQILKNVEISEKSSVSLKINLP